MSEFFLNFDVDSAERFDLAKFLEFNDGFDPLTSSFLRELKTLPNKGFFLVTGEQGRPDLIAENVYGDSTLWWVVLMFNSLISNEELLTGMTVSYPPLGKLEDLLFSLRAKSISAGV